MNQIGIYRNLEPLALGGMAEVYKAEKPLHDGGRKIVAIKRIRSKFSDDQELREMMSSEAKIVQHLEHPNIVQLYDYFEENDELFLVFQFIDGVTLFELFKFLKAKGEPVPWEVAIYAVSEVLKALDYSHNLVIEDKNLNVIHRDVSPQNILISREGIVKLADFGIAKAEIERTHTEAGVLKGKLNYFSPEQVRHEDVTNKSDLYSASVVLFEMINGYNPFTNPRQTEMLKNIAMGDRSPNENHKIEYPQKLGELVEKMMSIDPGDRLNDAKIFREQLLKIQEEEWKNDGSRKLKEYLEKISIQKVIEHSRVQNTSTDRTIEPETKSFITQKIVDNKSSQFMLIIAAILLLFLASDSQTYSKINEIEISKNAIQVVDSSTIISRLDKAQENTKETELENQKTDKTPKTQKSVKKYGTIDIKGPHGAMVYINGRNLGKAPLRKNLKRGSYLVGLVPYGQEPQVTRVKIDSGRDYILRGSR